MRVTTDNKDKLTIDKMLPIFADNVLKIIEKATRGSLTWPGACVQIQNLLDRDLKKFENKPGHSIIQKALEICNKAIVPNYNVRQQ